MAYADIVHREQQCRRLGDLAYASAFCKHFFGRPNPTKRELCTLARNCDLTVQEILSGLNHFLRSNGEYHYGVSSHFAERAFPSLRVSKETRFDNRCEMKSARNDNVRDKLLTYEKEIVQTKRSELLGLSRKGIRPWVIDNEDTLSEMQIYGALRLWFNQNVKHDSTQTQNLLSSLTTLALTIN